MEGSPSPTLEALALGQTTPGWPPGRRAHYCNVGYAVLGLVLERVAGCSYAEALRRHVLGPCAMTGSEPVTTAAAQARAPTGHLELPGGTPVPCPTAPAAGTLPGGLAPLVGTYAAWNPWTPELRVRPDAAHPAT
jgi:CubicO group peptidase (beta-lactamase class C family)